MAKHPVEAVEVPLVFHERGARQEIEFVDVEPRDPFPHRLQQGQELAQARRHLCGAQFEKEGDEHGSIYGCGGSGFKLWINSAVSIFPSQ
jgi:hypothetical protein